MSQLQVAAIMLLALFAPIQVRAQELLHELSSPHEKYLGGFGSSLSGVKDVDGDGRGDLLIGARQEDVGSVFAAGRAYVVSGASGMLLYEMQSPNPERAGNFGYAIADVSDADGDGLGDLLIGAPHEGDGSMNLGQSGRAYLFSGMTGLLSFELQSPYPQPLGFFGYAASGVPDVDGDRRGDLLVGAWGEGAPPPYRAGRAYIFSGSSGLLLHTLRSPNEEFGSHFGSAVAGVPDIDGDEQGDVLVGAEGEDIFTGRAYVFSGASGLLLHTLESPFPDLFARFGVSVAGVPDTDGDGRGDLLVGAPSFNFDVLRGAGQAYLFSGASGALLRMFASPTEEDFSYFGSSVSGVADVDGDGRGDLLIGAVGEDPGDSPSEAGRAYLFSGASGALLYALRSPNEEEESYFGSSVAGVPDTDGDGRGDLLVGATGEEPSGSPESAGRVYLFSGANTSSGLSLSAMPTTPLTVAAGGSVSFAYTVTNHMPQPATGDLFFAARRGGGVVASGIVTSGTLAAGQAVTRTLTQRVPGGAPPGTYGYTLHVGRFPATVLASEAFSVEVTGATQSLPPAFEGGWSVTATDWDMAAAEQQAAAVTAYPNPFRRHTQIGFVLAEAVDVRLAVYDVLGREVAVLVEGRREAGRHAAGFEAAGLPSGVYLWRLETNGRTETGRLTLL